MSQKRLSMRKIRELLRLKYELGRSHREIATSLGIANSTVSDYVHRAVVAAFLAAAGRAGRRSAGVGAVPGLAAVAGSPARAGLGTRPPGASAPQGSHGCCGWSTGRCIPTAISTAGSATATRRCGGTSAWSCGRSTRRARRRSSTTRARSSRSWTGALGRCASWSSWAFLVPRTTRSWT